jgi:heme/copper-type cytochrome/quinol oxidase subunit 2
MKWFVDIVFFTICLISLAVIAVLTFRVKRDENIEKKTIQTYLKIEIVWICLLILSALTYVGFKIAMML